MSYKVEIIPERDRPEWRDEGERHELVITHNGEEIAAHWDAGEPEDNLFRRDWGWIQGELERAYRLGFQDGIAQQKGEK